MKSIFKKSILLNNLLKFWWVPALSTILMFLAVPFTVLERNVESLVKYERYIAMSSILPQALIIIAFLAVIIGALVLRYMQTSKSVTLLHSMPFTRLQLYASNWLSGFILLIIPIIANFLILISLFVFTKYGQIMQIEILWKWLAIVSMTSISLYSITVMVGCFTGSSIAQMVFTYILNFLPVAAIAGVYYTLLGMLYGLRLNFDDTLIENVAKIMPITQMFDAYSWKAEMIGKVAIINLVIVILSLVIGYFVYKFRNLEKAGDVISNGVLKPIFKYGVTVCTMVLGTVYVKMLFNEFDINFLWYIVFALIGYVVAQMLLIKSFRILKYWKGFVGYVAVLGLLVLGIKLDVIGYETRVPNVDDVEMAVVDYYYSSKYFREDDVEKNADINILKEKSNIEKVTKLHQYLINNRVEDKEYTRTIQIGYKLKNGRFIEREYEIEYDNNMNNQLVEDIFSQDEYKMREKYFLFNEIEVLPHYDVMVESALDYYLNVKEEDKKELIYNVRKDILDLTYTQINESPIVAYVEVNYPHNEEINIGTSEMVSIGYIEDLDSKAYSYNRTYSLRINKNYTNTLNYLAKKGYEINDVQKIDALAIENNRGEMIKVIKDKESIKQIILNRTNIMDNDKELTGELIYMVYIYNNGRMGRHLLSFDVNDTFFMQFVK
ncbi:MAG: ABC transporter permease [Clostridiales bacterium]|nr:ABC transporter permease [Clostridiales bacterium]